MKRYIFFILVIAVPLLISCERNGGNSITNPPAPTSPGSASFYFQKPANLAHLIAMAEVVISAPDMDTIRAELNVTDSLVSGEVDSIPAGLHRKFEIFVYDEDTTLTYYGFAFADVPAGGVTTVEITLYPVNHTGTVIIVGTFSQFPPSEEKITFIANYTGIDDVYLMNPDGSNLTNLTNTPTIQERHPRISLDRQEIAFLRVLNNNLQRLFFMDMNGANVHELNIFPGHWVGQPDWSPDGQKLVLQSEYDGDSEIYIYDMVTQQTTQLTFNQATDWQPVWSPNGDWIAYQSDEGGFFKVYLIRPDGTGKHQLTNIPNMEERVPEFSPDGNQIAFYARDMYSTWDLFLINVDGTHMTRLTDTPEMDEYHQAWSPDGQKLIFTLSFNFNRGLYLYDLTTGTISQLLDDPTAIEDYPHWR